MDPEKEKLSFSIRFLNRTSQNVNGLKGTDKIRKVKKLIAEKVAIPIKDQKLCSSFSSNLTAEYEDEKTLSYYKLKSNDFLFLVYRFDVRFQNVKGEIFTVESCQTETISQLKQKLFEKKEQHLLPFQR